MSLSAADRDRLRKNLEEVAQRLERACARAGRKRDDVRLVAVTKSVDTEVAAWVVENGYVVLGESRPQELWRKAAAVPGARWHLIGHLQRNKIDRTLPLVEMVHSVDSLRLLQAVEAWGVAQSRPIEVLLEVNASGEQAKQGFAPPQLDTLVPHLTGLKQVRVRGLMTMAAFADDPEASRPTFALLRQCRDRLARLVPALGLSELSMGMSNDYEVAVEEGATLVRLGTCLFEGLSRPAG